MTPHILIPARYASTRLPGKPCIRINGKPAIRWVVDACHDTGFPVTLLTDDARVADAAGGGCGVKFITDPCENGTERCCIAAHMIGANKYLIVAGDEVCVRPSWLVSFALAVHDEPLATMLTGRAPYSNARLTEDGYIESITRADGMEGYEATGIYWYDRWNLERYNSLPGGHAIELCRMLDYGAECKAHIEKRHPGYSLNTPEDIELIGDWLEVV